MQDHRGCVGYILLGCYTDGGKCLLTILLSHTKPLRGARFGEPQSFKALRELFRVVRLGVFVVSFRLSENVITF